MVSVENTTIARNRPLHFNGFNHVSVDDTEAGVFEAYLEFAFHRTANDAEVYENAATSSPLSEQKNFFIQLACLKKEVADKLKVLRPEYSFIYSGGWQQSEPQSVKQDQEADYGMLATMNDAINFAFPRESKTLALYEKLSKTAHRSSVRVLFDYLLESQRHQLLFLTTQCAVTGCLL
jgi:rubrerythrin